MTRYYEKINANKKEQTPKDKLSWNEEDRAFVLKYESELPAFGTEE